MSGRTGRSGKRGSTSLEYIKPDTVLPELGDTTESIRTFVRAVTAELVAGRIDPRLGDTLTALARIALSSIKQDGDRSEVRELRELYNKVKDVSLAGIAKEVADRLHQK